MKTSLVDSNYLLLLLCLTASSSVSAFEIDTSFGNRQGEVTYQIGGQVTLDSGASGRLRFPLSELRFQINTPTINLKLSHRFRNNWFVSISTVKNISPNSGEMQDSDWGINYYFKNLNAFQRNSLDIYSESRLTLSTVDLKAELQKNLKIEFLPKWVFFIGGGISFQRFQFEAFDTIQSYPSTPEQPIDVLTGKTLTYRYEATMPFASASLSRSINSKTTITFSTKYSPWLKVTDYDNHILRDKISEGKSDGWGTILSASLNYALRTFTNLYLKATYIKTVANGIQTQHNLKEASFTTAKIGLRNTTIQNSIHIGISHRF